MTAPFPDCAGVVIGTSAGGVDALGLLLPALPADGQAAVFAEKLGTRNIALSITHTREQALAHVILES